MSDLKAKIDRLVVRYSQEITMPPSEVLGLLDQIRQEHDLRIDGLGSMLEALNTRVNQLEKKASTYTGSQR